MKKFLLTIAVVMTAFSATAQTKNYTDNLVVSIMGQSTDPQEATIAVTQAANGTYTLSLNNFMLGGAVAVGNIVVDGIEATETNGIKSFEASRKINITAGEGNEEWIGPMLGEVPVNLIGKMDDEKLYCSININMQEAEVGTIKVTFGDRKVFVEKTATYTDNLVVKIDGEETEPQQTTIIVDTNKDNTYTLSLNNFVLGKILPVGDIIVENITPSVNGKIANFTTSRSILITAGTGLEGETEWLGPNLGEVPINLVGKKDAENLYCTIDIDMSEMLGQTITVVFGEESKVTSIGNISVENGAKVIYDITGRRVNAITAPGIYIVNGKKTIIK